ncbi:hypothetical protein EDC18_102400 [Natranaerovirga pectinivora]|uniref:Uncharacterized protein n=1 Tax=Natranaerovirga pectinivora TaxID=682400 RepID=A0A4R3MQ16_9FIRM|nr:hypothetical protein [Natranaerovirga pectinivora]TCT16381.1 hypothetical protein EDC18_102400 [Natranaerovirga pectinivora]
MKKEYLERIKKENGWFYDDDFKANLIITDDCDSLLSAILLMDKYPNRFQIGYFYDFRDGLYRKLGIDDSFPVVGIDLSHPTIHCISNHVVMLNKDDYYNKNDINLNIMDRITPFNYFQKYNLNTLLLIYSLLGLKPKTKLEAATLLLPDSAFLGFYSSFENDNIANKKYLVDVLELPEVYEAQQELTKEKFLLGQKSLNIKSKLWVTDKGIEPVQNVDIKGICNLLGINYDPSVLEGFFTLIEKHNTFTGRTWYKYNKDDLFSFAVTRKNEVKYSKKV